jgi:hypothetical protein
MQGKNMKSLIVETLEEVYRKVESSIPLTKQIEKSTDISDMCPTDLADYITVNNIPRSAYFYGVDNSYDGWERGIILLSWEVSIPTTEEDKQKYKRKRFDTIHSKCIYDCLTSNGYTRKGFSSNLLKEFDGTTVYYMFINKQYGRLVKYYSLHFIKS